MIIAIDGPAAAGKSTTAREVARRLGFRHLDSGAFYRALTYAALAARIPPASWPALTAADLAALGVDAEPVPGGYALRVGGRTVDAELRTPEVNAHVSRMAAVSAIRDWLLDTLRAAARGVDLVADGRDIGTIVFPDAELKIFLVADPATRAARRLREQGVADPDAAMLAAEIDRIGTRDRLDSERETAPLRKAPDAIEVDTSTLTVEQQVERITALARYARG